MTDIKKITTDTVYMCPECRKRSGDGLAIQITYNNSGGWSPSWEGRLCEHLTVEDVLSYLGRE